jgi:hypothetical protein
MAHEVSFEIPERRLGKADIEFKVRRDGAILGTLKISKGALVWAPGHKKLGYKLGWTKFDELMQRRGKHGHR